MKNKYVFGLVLICFFAQAHGVSAERSFFTEALNFPAIDSSGIYRRPTDKAPSANASYVFEIEEGPHQNPNLVRIKIFVQPGDSAINLANVSVKYDSRALKFIRYDTNTSAFSIFIPNNLELPGELEIAGLQPFPGVSSKAEMVVLELEKASQYYPSVISLDQERSSVHANDGRGTEVLSRKTEIISVEI